MGNKMISIVCVAAALFCFVYCAVVFMVKSGGKFYLVWGVGGVFFLVFSFLMHFGMWYRIPLVIRRIFGVTVLIGIVLFVIVEGLIISRFHDRGKENLDYIIVLGAQMKPAGPSAVLKFRLDAAYDYLIENENTICILSGGQGSNEPCSEAEGMYQYLTGRGIAPKRLIMEDQSKNTSENIIYSMALIGKNDASIGIVTNNFHVFRGVKIAEAAGMQDVCGIAARSNVYFQPNNMVREFFGIMKDLVYGNLL